MWGLFGARADRRGLARLSASIVKELGPDRTLLVDMSAHRPFPTDTAAYADADVASLDDVMGRRDWSSWLDGIDTVLFLETPYTAKIVEQARARGVRTVMYAMPEYFVDAGYDTVGLPTGWLADRFTNPQIVPFPAEPFAVNRGDWVLHPAGGPAKGDRNGTRLVCEAALRVPDVLIRCQEPPAWPTAATVEHGDLADYRAVYDDADMVVLPRRYGGLSLAVQDALSAGLPVLTTADGPYAEVMPEAARLAVVERGQIRTTSGWTPTASTSVAEIARTVNALDAAPELRAACVVAAVEWCDQHSWAALRASWQALLAP